MIKAFGAWILAVLKAWRIWLSSSVVLGLVGLGQSLGWYAASGKVYIAIIIAGAIFAMFDAWRKEWEPNRSGPQVYMEWDSGQSSNKDMLKLRNLGPRSALNVRVGDFSWSELRRHRHIEIQAIHPNDREVALEAQFSESNDADRRSMNVGYLGHILNSVRYRDHKPLSVDVTFADANRTKFATTFFLKKSSGSTFTNPNVVVEMGRTKIRR